MRAFAAVALFALTLWNGIFDLMVTRGQIGYLWEQARAASGDGPPAVLHEVMAQTVRDAALTASAWAAVTVLLGALLIQYVRRGWPFAHPVARTSTPEAE